MGQYTVLVGKNNEGKSNLLRALNLAIDDINLIAHDNLRLTSKGWNSRGSLAYKRSASNYIYDTDFPKNAVGRSNKYTTIQLHFDLSDEDIQNFSEELQLQINDTLTLQLIYDVNDNLKIQVAKRGGRNWQKRIISIIKFVASKINFIYIPAVRTQDTFNDIIYRELRDALRLTTQNKEYESLVNRINALEQAAADSIAESITSDLSDWLPNVTKVRIQLDSHGRRTTFRKSQLFVTSSGTETLLDNKGDGVQSLFALALLAKRDDSRRNTILAIDEPEAHLHPEAIHRLQRTINNLTENTQVLVATHNPIFVNKDDESNNIIVDNGSVRKARSIREVRNILGVEVSDNLINANSVIVVEGVSDRIFLTTFIKVFGSPSLRAKINSGYLQIYVMHGLSNLKHTIQLFENYMVKFFIVLDADNPSSEEIKHLTTNQLISQKQFIYLPKLNFKKESELEDFYSNEFVADICETELNVKIKPDLDKSNKQNKWSSKMSMVLKEHGIIFEENEDILKTRLSEKVRQSKNPKQFLSEDGGRLTKNLIESIEVFFAKNDTQNKNSDDKS